MSKWVIKNHKHPFGVIKALILVNFLNISTLYGADPIVDECGYFADVLQTRNNPSQVTMINSGQTASIENSPSCVLNTGDVYQDAYGHGLACNSAFATASGIYASALEIDYSFSLSVANASTQPAGTTNGNNGAESVTVTSENQTLSSSNYNVVTQDYNHYDFSFSDSGDRAINSLQDILNTVTIQNLGNANLQIGSFTTNTYQTTTLVLEGIPQTIAIATLESKGSNVFSTSLEASQSITINTLTFDSSSMDTITLKAPTLTINTLQGTNNDTNITIYADTIDIGTLSLAQNNTIEIHPYTPGKEIIFRSDTIEASSSSIMIIDSGSYYTKNFNIPGTSDSSTIRASDNDQLINLYIDNSFAPGNNPGINSAGNEGNFGTLSPLNFRVFINGDLDTGGGGTTFNATVYVEGSATLGSPTYIKGSLSAGGDIIVGQDSRLVYFGDSNSAAYQSCPDTTDVTPPTDETTYSCGIFPSVLTSYQSITAVKNDVFNTCKISVKDLDLSETHASQNITCFEPDGSTCPPCVGDNCSENGTCEIIPEPINRYDHAFIDTTITESTTTADDITFTELMYGSYTFTSNNSGTNAQRISFEPTQTYENSDRKVMILGDIVNDGNNQVMSFNEGDYYFNSWDMQGNQVTIELNGDIKIFIKNDLIYDGNHANAENPDDSLFIYVGGNATFGSNGGGNSWLGTFLYVEGNVSIENSANAADIFGGITAEGSINISGENMNFYYDAVGAASLGFGECQLCYVADTANITTTATKVPILNLSSQDLKNVVIEESYNGTFEYGKNLSVVDQNDNVVAGSSTSTSSDKLFTLSYGNGSNIYTFGDENSTYQPSTTTSHYKVKQTYPVNFTSWQSNIRYVAAYRDSEQREYQVLVGMCPNTAPTQILDLSGPFDAWDTFRDNTSTPPADRNISTKIVNKPFQLSLASLNETQDAYETKIGEGSQIEVAIYPKDSLSPISNRIFFNANTTSHIVASENLTVTQASKDAHVGFKFCATLLEQTTETGNENSSTTQSDTGLVYQLYPDLSCSASSILNECNATTSATPTWHVCKSSDNFAIRPDAFKIFGKNQYKRAGEDFNLTIKAVDAINSQISTGVASDIGGAIGYNEPLSNLDIVSQFFTPSQADITQMQDDTGQTDVTTCPNSGSFTVTDANFANGEVNASLKFSETGILNINISEKAGSEFALIDADDTNDSQRYITPANLIQDESDISTTNLLLFVPYSLTTEATYNTVNGQEWLYMHDINNSMTTPLSAAYISYTITAKNKDGEVTQNYTKTCFPDTDEINCPRVNGLKLNTTFDLFLDAKINSSADANLSFFTEDDNGIAIWVPHKNKTISTGSNDLQEWISPLNFTAGVGKAKVYFNIDRRVDTALNPVKIEVVDANTSTSWMTNSGSPREFIGAPVNESKNFVYGKTNAPRQSFVDRVTPVEHDAFIYYEVFCDGTDCNKTLLPNGISSTYNDDPRWFVNTQHTSVSGTAGSVKEKSNSGTITYTAQPSGNHPDKVTLQYDGTKGYPFTKTFENNASSWLIYNQYNAEATHNEFTLEFNKDGGDYVGSGRSSSDVNISRSNTLNANENRSWW